MQADNQSARLDRVRELDKALAKQARKIRILSTLAWPLGLEQVFLANWRSGLRTLPNPPSIEVHLSPQRAGLLALLGRFDPADPLHAYMARTTQIYLDAIGMLELTGTLAFTERSIAIYGKPTDRVHPGSPTHLTAAQAFLDIPSDALPRGRSPVCRNRVQQTYAWNPQLPARLRKYSACCPVDSPSAVIVASRPCSTH